MDKDKESLRKIIREEIQKELETGLFTARKLTDMPTDDYQVTPRKYVNLYGTTAQRPVNSVIGQQYFDTTLGQPIFRNQNYQWVTFSGVITA